MNPRKLKQARLGRGWSQVQASKRLGVAQSYLAMLESGRRRLTPQLARRFMRAYHLSAMVLPLTTNFAPQTGFDESALARQLAALGYPGYEYLRPRMPPRNPGEVLLAALFRDELDSRLVEALPWLLLRYWEMDTGWLVGEANRFSLQNRLGFLVSLARRVSKQGDSRNESRDRVLEQLEDVLVRSRMDREDTFLRPLRSEAELRWVILNRSEDAKRWNLLTAWRPEHFQYAA